MKAWSADVDCTANDYPVPHNVQVTELRCTTAGDITCVGPQGEHVGIKVTTYDIARPPTIPENMRAVLRTGTSVAIRSGCIVLSGWEY